MLVGKHRLNTDVCSCMSPAHGASASEDLGTVFGTPGSRDFTEARKIGSLIRPPIRSSRAKGGN